MRAVNKIWKLESRCTSDDRKKARCSQWKETDSYHRLSEKAQKLEVPSTSGQRRVGRAKTGELVESL